MELSSILGLGLTVLVLGFNSALFICIKFNDMVHLSKDIIEIKDGVKEIQHTLETHSERIIKMETQCHERHSRKRNKIK
jgi:hypothetical protein